MDFFRALAGPERDAASSDIAEARSSGLVYLAAAGTTSRSDTRRCLAAY